MTTTAVPAPGARATGRTRAQPARAGVLGALALAAEVADELVLGTTREVHGAVARRVYGLTGRATKGGSGLARSVHDTISAGIYGGISTGMKATSTALRAADRQGLGPRVEDSPRGRFAVAAVNGLIGDRLAEQHPDLAITMAVRRHGRDVALEADALVEAFPEASGDLVVFLHGLCESEDAWGFRSAETGGTYGERLARETSWTPVTLRANAGLPIADNGAALAALLDSLVTHWPTRVRRIALVGHSMGGLIMRAACAVKTHGVRWNERVTDVVTLGTPHLGAPLERGVALGAKALGRLPEAAPFGRILEYRSVGILDLRGGLAPDIQHLPHARYRLVAATLAGSHRHPVSELFGDLLVRYPSAVGRPRRGVALFPDADVLHVRGHHFDVLNHDDVYAAMRDWLT